MNKRNKIPVSKTHPHLMEEWDFGKNEIRPEEVTFGSGKKIWWVCKVCEYIWSTTVGKRTIRNSGCPACTNQVVTETNNLEYVFPLVAAEWHPIKNLKTPKEVTKSTNKKYWWLCGVCGHEWYKTVNARTSAKKGCPVCANKVVTKTNSLETTHPVLALEWHLCKNKNLLPSKVTYGSQKKVWWLCKKCGYVWWASVCNRTKKIKPRGCPACAGQVVTEINNLAVCCPGLEKEWDYSMNNMLPTEIFKCDKRKVWWKCKKESCGYGWKAQIYDRYSHNSGCPRCSGSSVSKISQKWLDSLHIENREYYIKDLGFRVDGFDSKTNIVYEFLGDYWHGNPEVYDVATFNPHNKKPFGHLHEETFRRFRLLEKAGFKVVYIWENDFKSRNI